MATSVTIKLTSAGADAGPCDIYTNSDSFTTPVATGVTISQLTSPFGYLTDVPSGSTIVRVQNTGTCTNYEDAVMT